LKGKGEAIGLLRKHGGFLNNGVLEMNATMSKQQLQKLRDEFREYLYVHHPDWAVNTISMYYSDAFFGLNNNIGVDF
jgi:hypothetical protein